MKQLKTQLRQMSSEYFNIKYEDITAINNIKSFQPYIQERDRLGRLNQNKNEKQKVILNPSVEKKRFLLYDDINYTNNEETIQKRISEFKPKINITNLTTPIQKCQTDYNKEDQPNMYFTKNQRFIELYSTQCSFQKPLGKLKLKQIAHFNYSNQKEQSFPSQSPPPIGYYKNISFSKTVKKYPSHQFSKAERKFDWQNLNQNVQSAQSTTQQVVASISIQDEDRQIEKELKKSLKNSKLIQLKMKNYQNSTLEEKTSKRLEIQLSDFDEGSMKKLNLKLNQLRKFAKNLKNDIQNLQEKQLQSLNK